MNSWSGRKGGGERSWSPRVRNHSTRLISQLAGRLLVLMALLASVAGLPSYAIDIPVSIDGNLIFRQLEANEQTGQDAAIEFIFEELDSSGNPTGELYSLGQSSLINHAPGSTIHVAGILRDGSLLIPNSVTLVAPPGGGSSPTCSLGDQDMIVIVVNFQNLSAPCSNAQVNDVVFNTSRTDTANAFWDENALNTSADNPFSFSGVVAGPFTIAYTSNTSCSASKLVKLADQAATNAGYNLSNYTHRAYVFPTVPGSACTDAFSDGPAARVKRLYLFGTCEHHGFVHEYGHNLGMWHAGVKGDEYADKSDVMGGAFYPGSGDLRHNHGANKFSTCFIPSSGGNSRTLKDPASGTYTLGVVSQNVGNQTQTMRFTNIPITWSYNDEYFLTFRQPIGWDSNLQLFNGQVHYERTSINKFSTAKSDANWLYATELMGFIADGEEFRDYDAGLKVKQIGHTTTAATLEITRGALVRTDDLIAPAKPLGFQAPTPEPGKRWVSMSWQDLVHTTNFATDFRGYRVYRNNSELGTTPYPYFTDRTSQKGRTYTYYVRAYDDAGNEGPPSDSVTLSVPN